MTLRHRLLILFLFTFFIVKGQDLKDDKGVPWKFGYTPQHGPSGIVYQNEFLFQIGQRIGFKKKRELFSICGLIQFQKRTATYISPVLLLSYYKPIKKMVGPIISLEYSYRKINNITSNTITPEIGLCFYYFSLNFGYNIPIDNSFDWTTPYRVTLRAIGP
ncbi:MAG: hypothetical protein JNJ40_01620 [Bacteroidia bacterium]|nr:hypothetical protein [Bacteroidia bacterium]